MEQAIKIAIENGWKPFTGYLRKKFELESDCAIFYDKVNVRRFYFSDMVLDPLFWQALGKGLGWEETNNCWGCGYDEGATERTPGWKIKMHRFIDHLVEGKGIESFFTELIK